MFENSEKKKIVKKYKLLKNKNFRIVLATIQDDSLQDIIAWTVHR